MTRKKLIQEEKQETLLISKSEIFKQEVEIYCYLFVKANDELRNIKESFETLDMDRLKLIFGEVNIKKEGLVMNVFELSFEDYQEIEEYLADRFSGSTGPEKRAFAELKAGILNAKGENFII